MRGHGDDDGDRPQFNLPRGILAGSDGVYVADTFNNLIRQVSLNGYGRTLTGGFIGLDAHRFPVGQYRDGAIANALFNRPGDLAFGNGGNILILDTSNHAVRIIMRQNVFTLAGGGEPGFADGTSADAKFNTPSAMVVDGQGNIYIADSGNHVIRRIGTNGRVTTVAGVAGEHGHNDGTAREALFDSPAGITMGEDGRIFVADTGNHLIRMIHNGRVTTVAGARVLANEIDFDITYNANEWDNIPIGDFADGRANAARFNMPMGLAMWGDVLIVADTANHRIRAVAPSGNVTTIAGDGYASGTDGALSNATFHLPQGVSVFGDNLFVADTGNNAIRTINLSAVGNIR